MRFPNKVSSYNESVFSKLCEIIDVVSQKDMSLYSVYQETKEQYVSLSEFIDALDCLFMLNKVEYFEDEGVLHYVA